MCVVRKVTCVKPLSGTIVYAVLVKVVITHCTYLKEWSASSMLNSLKLQSLSFDSTLYQVCVVNMSSNAT